jgi:hypothetical protein
MFDVPEDRVEAAGSAELKQLTEVSAAEIMALMGREWGGYRGLYYAWEQQQWEVGSLDLIDDARQWKEELDDPERIAIDKAYRAVCISGRLTDLVVPLADAVPTEEQQVFMTTQLADTARHAVLQDRVVLEVVGEASASGNSEAGGSAPLGDIAERALAPLGAEARAGDEAATAAGVAILGLVVSGALAAALCFLSEHLRDRARLGGARAGINASLRDLTRHIAFGRLFVSEHGMSHPSLDEVLSRHASEFLVALDAGPDLPYPGTELRTHAARLMSTLAEEAGVDLSA